MSQDHATYLQELLETARKAAKDSPTAANIAAVERAMKAVSDFSGQNSGEIERFQTQSAALEYLQRRFQIEKSKLSKDVKDGKVPKKDGFFTAKDLDFYAEAVHLKPKTVEYAPVADGSERLKAAMAEEREFRVGILKGEYINAAEEEARDARLWFAVRTDLDNSSTTVTNEMFNLLMALGLPSEIMERIETIKPQVRMSFEDSVAEIFDRYAKDGGVEA